MKHLVLALCLTSCAALAPGEDTEPDPTATTVAETAGGAIGTAIGGPAVGAAVAALLGAGAGYFIRRKKAA